MLDWQLCQICYPLEIKLLLLLLLLLSLSLILLLLSQGHNVIKNIMGHSPVCCIPKSMEIESLVPRDKVYKAFQNIWAWKPSGHVTNILISSYLKVYIHNLVKKGQVVSSLSCEI